MSVYCILYTVYSDLCAPFMMLDTQSTLIYNNFLLPFIYNNKLFICLAILLLFAWCCWAASLVVLL
jgi:hypothetical protein